MLNVITRTYSARNYAYYRNRIRTLIDHYVIEYCVLYSFTCPGEDNIVVDVNLSPTLDHACKCQNIVILIIIAVTNCAKCRGDAYQSFDMDACNGQALLCTSETSQGNSPCSHCRLVLATLYYI